MATDHEISHGRDITWTLRAKQAPEHIRGAWAGTSWIVEVTATRRRDGKPFQATHLFLTSLRTTPQALLQLVRDLGLLEVCPSSPGSVVALTVMCAGTALDPWPPSPPPRLLQQVV